MPYFKTCAYCGAHLDFSEKCDCQEISARNAEKWRGMTRTERDGQIKIILTTSTHYEREDLKK